MVVRKARWMPAIAVAVGATLLALTAPLSAQGHGWVGGDSSDLTARAALSANTGRGVVQYEPQSLEGVGGFPATGPADGHIASAGIERFGELDEQSATRWVKNVVSPGPVRFGWTYTAAHPSAEWRYYITVRGWDPDAPLTRASFEPLAVVDHDGSPASTNPVHTLTIPSDRSGYHVILAVWEIADTANAFYNVIDVDIRGGGTTPAPEDVTAPTPPTGLAATSVAATSATLGWSAASDAVGVAGYRVYRDGVAIASTPGLSFSDTGLTPSTGYRYAVRAYDAAGNVSASSSEVAVTTAEAPATDTTPPTAPAGIHSMSTTATSVALMWSAATDDAGAVGYRVERALGSGAFSPVATTAQTMYTDAALTAATAYRYRVVAVDAAGNASAPSAVFEVTTAAAPDGPASWDAFAAYRVGDTVLWEGTVYVCRQAYQGAGDPGWITAQSLWTPVG